MKKIVLHFIIAFIIFLSGVIIFMSCSFLFYKKEQYNDLINSGTYKNVTFKIGKIVINADEMTAKDAYNEYLSSSKKADLFTMIAGDTTYEIDINKYCTHSITEDDFEQYIGDLTFREYLTNVQKEYTLSDKYLYHGGAGEEAKTIISKGEYGFIPSSDAYFDKKTLEVVPEVYGTEIMIELVENEVENAISAGQYSVDFRNDKFYIKPEIKSDEVREKFSKVFDLLEWKAEYSVSDYVIRMSDYKNSITVNDDGTYKVDDSFLTQAVLGLSKTIDNTYDSIKFHATEDGDITVKGGTYGQIMKNTKEIEFLKGKLKNVESVTNREPVWKCVPIGDENPNEYIEIDISEQHVWHYKDGDICCETDCVTGDAGKKRDTPTGAYYVSEMIPGKYLIGEGYKTWVDRWMRLTNSGVGLHDASWKSKFGGNIYKTNGSHGCINLPTKYAYNLYDEIYVGIPVIIHK